MGKDHLFRKAFSEHKFSSKRTYGVFGRLFHSQTRPINQTPISGAKRANDASKKSRDEEMAMLYRQSLAQVQANDNRQQVSARCQFVIHN